MAKANIKKIVWRDVQKVMNNSFFIKTCIEFNTRNMLIEARQILVENYINEKDFNYERVMKASKVCGPLVLWVKSHVHYSTLLQRVKPMEDEVLRLNKNLIRDRKKAKNLLDIVELLENNTFKYKKECAEMIRIIVRSHELQLNTFKNNLKGLDQNMNELLQRSQDL